MWTGGPKPEKGRANGLESPAAPESFESRSEKSLHCLCLFSAKTSEKKITAGIRCEPTMHILRRVRLYALFGKSEESVI